MGQILTESFLWKQATRTLTGLEFGADFFPVISWSLEDEMTVFQESHKMLPAVIKTLQLFMYFCICHENIFLHLDVWTPMSWKQVVQNSWLHSTLQRVTQALMRRELVGFFNREVAKYSSKARRSLNAHWLSQKQLDNLCTLQSKTGEKAKGWVRIHNQHFAKNPSHRGLILPPLLHLSLVYLCTSLQ